MHNLFFKTKTSNRAVYRPDERFNDADWGKMHQALLGVIESDFGTARSIRDLKEFQVAGKSGTAELVSLDSKEAYLEVRTSELLRDHSIIIAFGQCLILNMRFPL